MQLLQLLMLLYLQISLLHPNLFELIVVQLLLLQMLLIALLLLLHFLLQLIVQLPQFYLKLK